MLVELLFAGLLTASCDVSKAAVGNCGSGCNTASAPGKFSICETKSSKKTTAKTKAKPKTPAKTTTAVAGAPAKPQRLCSYYANGSIDNPTITVITAYVDVGSRLCIGDEVPEPKPVYKSVTEQLEEIFSAQISTPRAWFEGSAKPEPFQEVRFLTESAPKTFDGSLFGEPATIRFRPVTFAWSFSDGAGGSGAAVTKSFDSEGAHTAVAQVRYEVDYLQGGSWKLAAASFTLGSNTVSLLVVDPPRSTVLVP